MAISETTRTSSAKRSTRPLRLGLTIVFILLTLFGVPWWTLVAAGSQWPGAALIAGTIVFAGAMLAFPPLMYFGHRHGYDRAARIGDAILGMVWVLFAWSVLGNVLRLGLALGGIADPLRSRAVTITIVIVSAGLMSWGWFEAKRVPRVRRVTVTLPRLPAELDGIRIVQLTDLHYGPIDRTRWSERVVEAVNALDADIVCITGDVGDGTVARRHGQLAPLANVRASLAKLYVSGNHEHFGDVDDWANHMHDLGWVPLRNRHIDVQRGGAGLTVAGIDDASATASSDDDLSAALAGADSDQPVLLLAHQPRQVDAAVARDVDLQLSGHTHGGQIWPFALLVRAVQPSVHGLSRHGKRTQLHTSRGTGFWGPPLRIFAPSEITLLTLTNKRQPGRGDGT